MGRIVLHKHYSAATSVTADKFVDLGELVISNEVGNEGIYIINTNGDVVKIGYNGGGSPDSGGTTPVGDYITLDDLREYLDGQAYITSADTEGIVSSLEDALSGVASQILTEEQVRDIVISEISFLVSSADTMFDTLRSLAEWIENDETGSAQLIADVVNVKDAVSGLTERVSTAEEDIDTLESDVNDIAEAVIGINGSISELSGSVVEHIAQNEADLQELNDKIGAIEIPEIPDIPEPVTDEHIRDIAAQEVSSLVSSADSMYQVLQELAEWVENDESGSAQLIADVAELKDDVAELSAATENSVGSLNGRVDAVEDAIENLPLSGGSIDEETLNALRAYIDEQIASIRRDNEHVFLSLAEYRELVTEGQVTISGQVYYYSDSVYYCIYQGEEPTPPTPTGDTIDYEISGETINFNNGVVEDGGFLNIGNVTIEDGFINLDAPITPTPSGDDEPSVDEEGMVDMSGSTVDNNGFIDLNGTNLTPITD